MNPDWSVVVTVAAPVIALFVGIALNRFLERKPKLIAYYTHSSAFVIPGANPVQLNTHGIVIKNVSKKPATDIRVRHNYLPKDFYVFPVVQYQVQKAPRGGAEIVFPTLVPNEQVSISYLYFPPVVYSQIHGTIRHTDGFATEVTALPTPQYPTWVLRGAKVLMILGIAAFLYIVVELGRFGMPMLSRLLGG